MVISIARDTTMRFAKQSTWRVVQDNKFTPAKKRKHIGRLADMDENDSVTEHQYSSHLALKKMMLKIL